MENELENKKINERTITAEARQYEDQFIHVIKEKLGLEIHKHQINLMIKTIINACKKFNASPAEYLEKIRASSTQTQEIEFLTGGITIGETYFFRDKKQMKVISEYLLPEMIQRKRKLNNLSLRIWSAGCSSGEEIYSIAMYLVELIKDIPDWKISLIATDINVDQLRKAAIGEYGEWSMRSITSYYKDKYFIKKKNKYCIQKELIKMVEFEYLNLNDNNYPSLLNNTSSIDFIICRNVLIYFDEKVSRKILERLASCLETGAYMMLGASDPLYISSKILQVNSDCATLFKKEPLSVNKKKITTQMVSIEEENKTQDESFKNYNINNERNVSKKDKVKDRVVEVAPVSENNAIKLINQEAWSDLIQLVEMNSSSNLSTEILIGYATALANVGRQSEAIIELEKLLTFNKTNVNVYLVYALTLIELNRHLEAEVILRQALFLDRKLVTAYFQLGLLLLRNLKHAEGIKCLKSALALTLAANPDEIVRGGSGITNGQMSEILKKEIQIYSSKKVTNEYK